MIYIEAPLKSLEGIDAVYVPDFTEEIKYCSYKSCGVCAKRAFQNNIAFATPEAAIACHDAILKGIITSH